MSHFHGTPIAIAGTGLSAASGLGSAALSYGRARAYMKEANEELFYPRNLQAEVLKTKDMMQRVGFLEQRLRIGSSNAGAGMQQQSSYMGAGTWHYHPMETAQGDVSIFIRRSMALQGYISELDYNVPPPTSDSENMFKRLGEKQAARQAEKQREKLAKKHREAHGGKERAKMEEKIEEFEHKLEQARNKDGEVSKKVKEIEKDILKERRKGEKKVMEEQEYVMEKGTKQDRKEEKVANRVRWIVISMLKDGEGKGGKEVDLGEGEGTKEQNVA